MATTLEKEEEQAKEAGGPTPPEDEKRASPPRGLLREYTEGGAVVLVMAFFFMTFVAQSAEVPSASMENTIYVGDHFLINKFIFAPGPALPFLPQREIRRGDIIVFKYPSKIGTGGGADAGERIVQYKTLFIKRVVGLPGETIEIRGATVYVDGKPLPEYRVTALDPNLGNDKAELKELKHTAQRSGEPYTVYYTKNTIEGLSLPPSIFRNATNRPFKVPADSYFVMGDNRDNSQDSRVWGTVPRDLVVGRAMFVIWSYDEHAPRSRAPFPLNFIADFFNNTRWGRTGTLLR